MARPAKRGLDYFPLDVDFMQDRKIRRIKREYGIMGVMTVVDLYAKIYHENGYYLVWDDNICYDISEEVNAENAQQLQEIVMSCLDVGLFHKELYEKEHILTSDGIQRRFRLCSNRRCAATIAPEFDLLDSSAEITSPTEPYAPIQQELKYTETPLMYTEMPQTKPKKTKEKQRERNLPPTPSQKEGGAEMMTIEQLKISFSPPDYALNKKTHNCDGLLERLYTLGVHSLSDIEAIMRLSRYGEIGQPIWRLIVQGKWVGEKKTIAAPGKYIIKVLLNLQKQSQS